MSVCLYSCLCYPACKSHFFCAILHYHPWPVWFNIYIFPHYLMKGKIFGKKFNESKMCVLIFSYNFCLKFLIPRRIQQYIITHVHRYSGKIPYIHNILIKFKFSWQILEKSPNIKYHENPTSGSWIIPCRQTDEWTDRRRN